MLKDHYKFHSTNISRVNSPDITVQPTTRDHHTKDIDTLNFDNIKINTQQMLRNNQLLGKNVQIKSPVGANKRRTLDPFSAVSPTNKLREFT